MFLHFGFYYKISSIAALHTFVLKLEITAMYLHWLHQAVKPISSTNVFQKQLNTLYHKRFSEATYTNSCTLYTLGSEAFTFELLKSPIGQYDKYGNKSLVTA